MYELWYDCLQLNPIGGSQIDFKVHTPFNTVNFRDMAFIMYERKLLFGITHTSTFGIAFHSLISSTWIVSEIHRRHFY